MTRSSNDLNADQTLEELAAIAFSDPRSYFDDQGNLCPTDSLTPEQGAALQSMKIVKLCRPEGDRWVDIETIVRIRLWDKPKALVMLAKHFGLLRNRIDHSGEIRMGWETTP